VSSSRLLTRADLPAFIRQHTGIPISHSKIDKLAMQGRGPRVAAVIGYATSTPKPTRSHGPAGTP
jgi:hypothetical protein